MFRLRGRRSATAARVHALALRSQIRIEPQRRRYQPSEEERLYELFGETPQWGDSLRPFLWTHVATTVGGFDGHHGVRPADRVHLRLRGRRRPSTCTPWPTATSPCSSCSRARCSPRGRRVLGRAHLVVDPRPLPPAGAVWRGDDGPLLPEQRLAPRPAATPSTGCSGSGRPEACPTWDQAFEQLLKEAGEDGDERDEPRRLDDRFDAARAVADAVLYEGYVLYPYRASSRKNQSACSSGCSRPGRSARRTAPSGGRYRTECLRRARRRASPASRSASGACRSQHRARRGGATARRHGGPAFAPVDTLEVDGTCHVEWDEAVDQVVDLPPLADSAAWGDRRHEVRLRPRGRVRRPRCSRRRAAGAGRALRPRAGRSTVVVRRRPPSGRDARAAATSR